MKNLLCLIFVLLLLTAPAANTHSQQPEDVSFVIQRDLIDFPRAGTHAKSNYSLGLRVFPQGGVISDFSVGIFNRFQGSIFYGGENIIGVGDVNWNPHVGVDFRIRLIDETMIIPGIAIGVNTQGWGGYISKTARYHIKSTGLYAVASRNYSTQFGDMGFHGGVNFSLERDDDDKDLNFFVGFTKSIRNFSEILVEYDAAINDNEPTSQGEGSGYLNAGLRFMVSNKFTLTFHFKDLLENTKNQQGLVREIRLEFSDTFRR